MADGKYRRLTCVGCALPRQEYVVASRLRNQEAHPRNWFTCEHCGRDSHRKLSGSQSKDPNYRSRWCSMECKAAAFALLREGPSSPWYTGHCKDCGKAMAGRTAQKKRCDSCAAYKPRVKSVACVQCGSVTQQRMGRPRKFCSEACKRASAGFKEQCKAAKKRRRARKRGVRCETVNVLRIFERDKWVCHLCGVKTKKKLRGTCDPLAPELDHVVPLSLGGAHAPDNVACSCRQCNGFKGAMPIGRDGQGLLLLL